MMGVLRVINREGVIESWRTVEIIERYRGLVELQPRLTGVNYELVAIETIKKLPTRDTVIRTKDIDNIAAGICANMVDVDVQYADMASRIVIDCHHKHTKETFSAKVELLDAMTVELASISGMAASRVDLFNPAFVQYVREHAAEIDNMIDYSRDFMLTYNGFLTLHSSYLLKDCSGVVIERPQDMFMRVAIAIFMHDAGMDRIASLYNNLSLKYCTHATPTLYNAGLRIGQLSSCFLLGSDDSSEGIMKTATDCALISKAAGGIGFHTNWRAQNSYIRSTNGFTNGKFGFIEIHAAVSKGFDQGGSKRKGSFAMYEPLHDADIERFLDMWRISGNSSERNRTIYIAVWVPDLFMKRLQENGKWSLFSFDQCGELYTSHGEQYEQLYLSCEANPKLVRKTIEARDLFRKIYDTQVESGLPYILYGDSANRFSNQQNLGTIRSSNLCSEIVMYSDAHEYGVCNLASICLGRLVEDADGVYREFPQSPRFNFLKLIEIVRLLVNSLNAVIDVNVYPVPEARLSNMKHRPIGIGVQGLANVFAMFGLAFDRPEAFLLNRRIFETIYHAAAAESCAIAQREEKKIKQRLRECGSVEIRGVTYTAASELPEFCGAYETFAGSPLSRGLFRWQLSGLDQSKLLMQYDWDSLRSKIQRYGTRNSLLIALMPTASTSTIMNQVESFEPYKTNYHVKNVKAGTLMVYNQYLFNDLKKLGCATPEIYQHILANNGSVQGIVGLPDYIKQKYRTAYEIHPLVPLRQAIERQHFIDQSQSFNQFFDDDVDYNMFKRLQMTAWKNGMITGAYYTHRFAAADALKFTVTQEIEQSVGVEVSEDAFDGSEVCLSCGS